MPFDVEHFRLMLRSSAREYVLRQLQEHADSMGLTEVVSPTLHEIDASVPRDAKQQSSVDAVEVLRDAFDRLEQMREHLAPLPSARFYRFQDYANAFTTMSYEIAAGRDLSRYLLNLSDDRKASYVVDPLVRKHMEFLIGLLGAQRRFVVEEPSRAAEKVHLLAKQVDRLGEMVLSYSKERSDLFAECVRATQHQALEIRRQPRTEGSEAIRRDLEQLSFNINQAAKKGDGHAVLQYVMHMQAILFEYQHPEIFASVSTTVRPPQVLRIANAHDEGGHSTKRQGEPTRTGGARNVRPVLQPRVQYQACSSFERGLYCTAGIASGVTIATTGVISIFVSAQLACTALYRT